MLKLYLSHLDNIWDADLAYVQLTSKLNKRIRSVFCILDIYSKYAWFITFKDKKCITSTNAFKNCMSLGVKQT